MIYVGGAALVISTTPGLGSVFDPASWWDQPIVYQKLIVWTLLYEVVGLGCGSGPLTSRFNPPIGSILYWLRPGTIRLPPWPDQVPLTRGDRAPVSMSPSTPSCSAPQSGCSPDPETEHRARLR